MKVEDIMTKDVICVNPGTSVVELLRILRENKIHSVPVVEEDNKLAGIVTEMDFFIKDRASAFLPAQIELFNNLKPGDPASWDDEEKIGNVVDLSTLDIMTTDCTTVSPDTDIKELLDVFKRTHFKSFPVVNKDNFLVGVVSLMDVFKVISI